EEDGRGDRATKIAHATDNNDDKGLKHPVEPHGVVDADQWPEQHPARRCHAGAEREGGRMHQWYGNAHRLRHHAILRRGPDPDSVFAEFEEKPETTDDCRRKAGDHKAVPGVFKVEQCEVTAERLLDFASDRPKLPKRIVLQDQRDAERSENGGEWIAPQQRPQGYDLNRGPE